jgi:hypothetical protein
MLLPTVPRKDKTFPRVLQILQYRFQMRCRIKIHFRIVGHDPMEVTRNVCIPNGSQNIRYDVGGTIVNLPILEVLNSIGNQTTLRHAKQIVQGLETGSAFVGSQCSFDPDTPCRCELWGPFRVPPMPRRPCACRKDGKSTPFPYRQQGLIRHLGGPQDRKFQLKKFRETCLFQPDIATAAPRQSISSHYALYTSLTPDAEKGIIPQATF